MLMRVRVSSCLRASGRERMRSSSGSWAPDQAGVRRDRRKRRGKTAARRTGPGWEVFRDMAITPGGFLGSVPNPREGTYARNLASDRSRASSGRLEAMPSKCRLTSDPVVLAVKRRTPRSPPARFLSDKRVLDTGGQESLLCSMTEQRLWSTDPRPSPVKGFCAELGVEQ